MATEGKHWTSCNGSAVTFIGSGSNVCIYKYCFYMLGAALNARGIVCIYKEFTEH